MSDALPLNAAAPATPVVERPSIGQQAIKEAVEQLRAALPKLQETSPPLAESVRNLVQRADDPVRLNQSEFQHRVAYAIQDVIGKGELIRFSSPEYQSHLTELSRSAPGLKNQSIAVLLEEANHLQDFGVRLEIRRTAIEVGRQSEQSTPQIQSQIEALENRMRLAEKTTTAAAAVGDGADKAPPLAAGLNADGRTVGSNTQAAQAGEAPGTSARGSDAVSRKGPDVGQPEVQAGAGGLVANALLRGFERLGQSIPPAPWETMTTNFGDRLKTFAARREMLGDEKVLGGVEQSGRAAIEALQSFANNEGAVMMNRINQAARSDPNGMDGVIADMRPGGKYAGLRQQFNNAISDEKGFAAAYDKAIDAVSSYVIEKSDNRTILARTPDSVAVTTKLEAIDQNIAERMAGIPSRSDGKAMMDDLRKQAAEIFKAVAEGLKNLFQRPSAGASASPTP